MRTIPTFGLALALATLAAGCRECDDPLALQSPQLIVEPTLVHMRNVGIAQDTPITITIRNPSFVDLREVKAELILDESDPAFRIVEEPPADVLSAGSAEVRLVVRPVVLSTIEATLRITAEEDARPTNVVEVPIIVESADLGLPDIHTTPQPDDGLVFGKVGQFDVVQANVTVENTGVRDLLIDAVCIVPKDSGCGCTPESDEEAEACRNTTPFTLSTAFPAGFAIAPIAEASLVLAFAPTDVVVHEAELVIESNDPDENPVRIAISGQGSQCPIAVASLLPDHPDGVEPLDTVRLSAEGSHHEDGVPYEITAWEWTLIQRPIGSTAVLDAPEAEITEMTTDIAGTYIAALRVYDSEGIRSCNEALVTVDVIPNEELLIELVWDHPTADLDLHMVRQGGQAFTHDGDVYFSNREPEFSVETPSWSQNPDENPTLDADDNRGYGPENVNIVDPAAGSVWQVLVHYWSAQTSGDPFVVATLRVYVYGQLEAELQQTFTADETLWRAVEIRWPQQELAPATITQLGVVEPFARPF